MEQNKKNRLLFVLCLFVVLLVVGKVFGAEQHFSKESMKELIERAGLWGYLLFFVIIAVGQLFQLPSGVFIAAAILAYGKVVGGFLGVVGAIFSANVGFLVIRGVGGKALADLDWKYLQRVLGALEKNPIRTTLVVRFIFTTSPQLNFALGLSNLRFREHFIGTTLGLVIPLTGFVLFFDWFVKVFFS